MAEIRLNGELKDLPEGTTVTDLLIDLGVSERPVAVERNGQIVPRSEHASTTLARGDRVEVVSFVPGG